jgi:hypothetical protein
VPANEASWDDLRQIFDAPGPARYVNGAEIVIDGDVTELAG